MPELVKKAEFDCLARLRFFNHDNNEHCGDDRTLQERRWRSLCVARSQQGRALPSKTTLEWHLLSKSLKAMVTSTGVRDVITTLQDLQQRLGLVQAQRDDFFTEWTDGLPTLTAQELDRIDWIKRRYDYHRADGLLLEGTINLVVTAPLLELLGFVDPPFRLKSPYGIALALEDPEEPIRGFIDVLVLQGRLWILTVASKRTSISAPAALPQLLAYMAANPEGQLPQYGMATNGDEFVFLKLGTSTEYDVSRSFSLFPRRHELGQVAQILKALGQCVLGQG